MSDVQSTPAAVAVPATETVPTPAAEVSEPAPVVDEQIATSDAAPAVIATEESKAAEPVAEEAKPIEPVNEGMLGYKAPGLLKQFTFAKKDFFFSDEAVAPANLESYLRGEKAEIAHPVVAYASQTGKGLLFFVKKGESDKTKPAGVLPLYEATDLKKASQHEFSFRLHNQSHTFKAASDVERDGWYQSIEKSIELGKAQKDSIVESEGYKAELQKLSGPEKTVVPAAAGVATAGTVAGGVAAASHAKKSTDIDRAEVKPAGSDDDEEVKKTKKSRSTSRGLVARLRGKKEELEAKVEKALDEHEAEKDNKKADAELPAPEAATEAVPAEETTTAAAVEEKPKPSKRGSIFGSLKAVMSPSKEKDAKEAELKSDAPVSETAPQLPETAAAPAIVEPEVPATTEAAPVAIEAETAPVAAEPAVTPTREKKNFLSGIGFLNKRDRSVSPSAPKETSSEVPAIVDNTEPASIEPAVEASAAAVSTTEPIEAAGNVETTEETPAAKRQSVFGGLGRRASKMIQRVQSSNKKETPAVSEGKAEETPAVLETSAEKDLAAHEATEPVVENKPESVVAPASTTVTASA